MAGYLLMTVAPFVLASVLLSGTPRSAGHSVASAHTSVSRRPTISLSIEPPALSPVFHPEPPVVLPGYVLPDDGTEEASHEGG
jgi:hypothetical protein